MISFSALYSCAQKQNTYNAIYSGIPWFDNKGNVVSAHGACIIKEKGKFYLFGEKHSDTSNAFAGFTCYSSEDLYNWKFESLALAVQSAGKLGPNRVGERVKVMKCPKTSEFVMYMHVDTLTYRDQFVGYATAKTITGPYTFQGPLLFNGKPIKKWDMGTFQDSDGAGYVLLHGGDIYRLSDDYKSVVEQTCKSFDRELEAPTVFRKDSFYFFLGSHLTSWEKNDNYYFTANSLKGPWTARGIFAPEGSLTWNSQATFLLPVMGTKQTTYLFMGDRWSFPKQASAATYVWQPLQVVGTSLSIPKFQEGWKINTTTGVVSPVDLPGKTIENTDQQFINYSGNWQHQNNGSSSISVSDEKGASFSINFKGTQAGVYALSQPNGGYASLQLRNGKGQILLATLVDMYSKYPVSSLKFLTPQLKRDSYTLTISVIKEKGNWSDKRKSDYGSTGYFVSLDKIVITE